jgi:hypothetical protein
MTPWMLEKALRDVSETYVLCKDSESTHVQSIARFITKHTFVPTITITCPKLL